MEAARDLDAKTRIVTIEETLTYSEMLVRGAARGNLDAVRMALSCGADTSFVGSFGRTPLIIAAMHGHADVVTELAAAPGALLDAVDFNRGWSALMYAARWGMEHIVQLLLDCGADTEVVGTVDGETVRNLAYDWGYDRIAAMIDRSLGVDVELPEDDNGTALGDEEFALLKSVKNGDVLGVMDALSQGAEIDCVDSRGWTPLITAINAGQGAVVAILLGAVPTEANVEAAGPAGWTPLMFACRWGQLETISMLLEKEADVGTIGADGSDARRLLGDYEHEDLVDVVLMLKKANLPLTRT